MNIKTHKLLVVALGLMTAFAAFSIQTNAQIIWNTGSVTFTKTMAGQQDCITPGTCLTRQTVLYNSVLETVTGSQGCGYIGPANTEWAYGNIANWNTLTYQRLYAVNGCTPPSMVGNPLVLHLISENIYLQVTFNSWQGGGGGFSYTRTTAPVTAASVSVSGRVFANQERGLSGATVTLTNSAGNTVSTRTSSFGYYRFSEVPVGETVTIEVKSKRYNFEPHVLNLTDEIEDLDFYALP